MPNIDVRLPIPPDQRDANLPPHINEVLEEIFAEYERVIVLQSFQSGFSGSQVLLVRPILQGNDAELPAVIKIDRVETMDSEWDAYKTYIRNKLPNAIKMDRESRFFLVAVDGRARDIAMLAAVFLMCPVCKPLSNNTRHKRFSSFLLI